jgi:hypothetical protein
MIDHILKNGTLVTVIVAMILLLGIVAATARAGADDPGSRHPHHLHRHPLARRHPAGC